MIEVEDLAKRYPNGEDQQVSAPAESCIQLRIRCVTPRHSVTIGRGGNHDDLKYLSLERSGRLRGRGSNRARSRPASHIV